MQDHVLRILHSELERTHDLVEDYKISGIKELIFSLFWKSFKKILAKYARKKEDILMGYATLHYDIWKDIKNSQALPTDVEHIRIWISSITYKIESCSQVLQLLISHSQRQEDILQHEKVFFVKMIESFNSDLIEWVSSHEKEIIWEVSTLENIQNRNSLERWKKLLEKQKQKLEQHIDNLSKK
jgi:hypothetical protein